MLRIGIVGAGGMGTVHCSNYAHIEGCCVAALCDASPAAQEKANELGVPLYTSLEEMLAAQELEIVDVCTPTFLHKAHVMTALRAGKHVLCEKPLALHEADAREMLDEAQARGVVLFAGQVLQYAPQTAILRRLVQSGEYGRVLDASFLRLSACPRWSQNGWLFDRERSGHLPFDLHIHDLDLIVSLFGAPRSMRFTSCGNSTKHYREHYRFSYEYDDKNISAEAAWFNADLPFTATWRVYFENAVVENTTTAVTAYRFDQDPYVFDTTEPILIPTGINLPPTGIFYSELSDFIAQVKSGQSGCIRREELLTVIRLLEEISTAS